MWVWALSALGIAVIATVVVQYRARAGVHRPLASRQPVLPQDNEVPLGMEALDLDHVARTTRRNESLERSNTRNGTGMQTADSNVTRWVDDETYASRYHAAFQADKSKDK